MTLTEKALKTVEKLLELTQEDKITWSRFTDTRFLTQGTNLYINIAYKTEHAGSFFRAYEERYQTMDADDRVNWTGNPRIDLTDSNGLLLWELPFTSSTWDLLRAIQVKAGKVEDKLDDFLKA